MYFKKSLKMTAGFVFVIVLLFGSTNATFGQKDHGKGHDKDGGEKNEGKHKDEERGNRGDRGERPSYDDRQERQAQRPQRENERRSSQQNDEGDNRGDNGKNHGKGKWKDQRDEDRRGYNAPIQQQNPWSGGWIPRGQIRSQQVHERNAERKARKDDEKAYRRESRDARDDQRYYGSQWPNRAQQIYRDVYPDGTRSRYDVNRYGNSRDAYTYQRANPANHYPTGGYYDPRSSSAYGDPNSYGYDQDPYANAYGQNPYSYNGASGWKTNLLRTLISSILGGLGGGGGNDNYYNNAQADPYYSSGPVRNGYYDPGYYNGGYTPQNAGYDPGYSQYSNYGVPQYNSYSDNSGGLLSSLPLGRLFGQRSGAGGFITQIFSQVLAQGYLQGLFAGQTARQAGYNERSYYDPYVSQGGLYDPYSYSMGQNRRTMSEGYGLGYNDALDGRNRYDQAPSGNLDLVTLLLSSVLGNV